MGNSQPKLTFSPQDAVQILGRERWQFARSRLSQGGAYQSVDYTAFAAIVQARFPTMPEDVLACLYRGFSGEIQQKMEIDAFLACVALFFLPNEREKNSHSHRDKDRERDNITQQLRLLFRVYEQDGELPRTRLEKFLTVIYGREALEDRPKSVQKLFDGLYGREQSVAAKEFESFAGPRELLAGWVKTLCGTFFEPLPPSLMQLYKEYTPHIDAEDVKARFRCKDANYSALQRVYIHKCALGPDWSLSLSRWFSLVTPLYVTEPLAALLFEASLALSHAQIHALTHTPQRRRVWKFPEFLSFVLTFSRSLSPSESLSLSPSSGMMSPTHTQSSHTQTHTENPIKTQAESERARDKERETMCEEIVTAALQLGIHLYDSLNKADNNNNSNERSAFLRDTLVLFIYALSLSAESVSVLTLSQRLVWREDESPSVASVDRELSEGESTTDTESVRERSLVGLSLTGLCEEMERDSDVSLAVKTAVRDALFSHTLTRQDCEDVSSLAQQGVRVLLSLSTQRVLPGLRDLTLTACALFTVAPPSPAEEKEMITELTMRYMRLHECDPAARRPFGRRGTLWSVIDKQWLEKWKRHVGRRRVRSEPLSHTHSPTHTQASELAHTAGTQDSSSDSSHNTHTASQQSTPQNTPHNALTHVSMSVRERESDWPGPVSTSSLLLPAPPSSSPSLSRKGPYTHTHTRSPSHSLTHTMRPGLYLGRDFEAVPPPTAQALLGWYGGGPEIVRETVRSCDLRKVEEENEEEKEVVDEVVDEVVGASKADDEATEVEFYPLSLRVFSVDAQGRTSLSSREVVLSRTLTVADALSVLSHNNNNNNTNRDTLSLSHTQSSVRLWGTLTPQPHVSRPLSPSLSLGALMDGAVLLERERDGRWPLDRLWEREKEKAEDIAASEGALVAGVKRNSGLVGLDNLGNTCYLNASLQCLLHLDLLTQYFLNPHTLKKHLNPHNVHGRGGRLALKYAQLVRDLWTTEERALRDGPRYLLQELASAQEQFRGHEQHDASELLAVLLDYLSEDLNRVMSKPYLAQPDSHGSGDEESDSEGENEEVRGGGGGNDEKHTNTDNSPGSTENGALLSPSDKTEKNHKIASNDALFARKEARLRRRQERIYRHERELASIWWENSLRREDSVITAVFQGQYKSLTSCEVCGHHSARYEPFLSLSLPLPDPEEVQALALCEGGVSCGREERDRTAQNTAQRGGGGGARSVSVCVIPRRLSQSVRCVVRVSRAGCVRDVVQAVRRLRVGCEADSAVREGCVEEEQHFVVCEVSSSGRVRRFVSMHRSLDTVRENDMLVCVEVEWCPTLVQRATQTLTLTPTQTRAQTQNNEGASGTEGDSVVCESERHRDASLFPFRCLLRDNTAPLVRVALCLRKPMLMDNTTSSHNLRGYAHFRLTSIGLPVLDVMPATLSANVLYACVAHRLREFLTQRALTFLSHNETSSQTHTHTHTHAPADEFTEVRPCTTEEVLSGAVPQYGFTIRLITGGATSAAEQGGAARSAEEREWCSRCVGALSDCEGCVVPCRASLSLSLRDGESLAVDLHWTLLDELSSNNAAFRGVSAGTHALPTHASWRQDRETARNRRIPLSSCLAKFAERETLEDVVCPRCVGSGRGDGSLSRSIALYRCPPVLVVQLKRFQFDRISRKKLNQRVDFPRNSLDLSSFLAPSARHTNLQLNPPPRPSNVNNKDSTTLDKSTSATTTKGEEGAISRGSSGLPCTEYALASVIHHEGVLGGGHYVATVRTSSLPSLRRRRHPRGGARGRENGKLDGTGGAKESEKDEVLCEHAKRTDTAKEKREEEAMKGAVKEEETAEHNTDNNEEVTKAESEEEEVEEVEESEEVEEKWHMFNDHDVSEVDPSAVDDVVGGSSAYVLFYVRKDCSHAQTHIEELLFRDSPVHNTLSQPTQDTENSQHSEHSPSPTESLSHNNNKTHSQSNTESQSSQSANKSSSHNAHTQSPSRARNTEEDTDRSRDRAPLRRIFGGHSPAGNAASNTATSAARENKWFSFA